MLRVANLMDRLAFHLRRRTRGASPELPASDEIRQQVTNKGPEPGTLRAAPSRGALALAGNTGRTFPVFFIVGFAKSGTSWVARILDAHPEVLCKGEGIFFGRGADLGARQGLLTPTSLYGALADSEYLRAWRCLVRWGASGTTFSGRCG